MRICHLTSVHPWNDTRIFHKMCRSLAEAGHEVHLVAAAGPDLSDEIVDGVRIHLIPQPRNRLQRMWRTTRRVLDRAASLNADLYHFHDPEFLLWALRFQRRVGAPVIYDAHEDYRVHMAKPWLPRPLRWVASRGVGRYEDRVVPRLAGVISATPHIARRFEAHPKGAVVQNFPRLEEFAACDPGGERERGLFVHVGGAFTAARGIVEMIEALPHAGPEARLALAGRWRSEELRARCIRLAGWPQVRELGFLQRPAMVELLSRSQAGVVLFHPLENHVRAQPNKIFEYMAAGLQVIASDFPLWRKIIGEAECGLLVDPLDPRQVGDAMRAITESPERGRAMGALGQKRVADLYAWPPQFARLAAFYERSPGCVVR